MALHLCHYANKEENRNENGINAIIVEAVDVAAATVAAKAAMPPGGRVTITWTVQLLSAVTPPLFIQGNAGICPPGIRRGS